MEYRDENRLYHRPWQEGPAVIWPDGSQFYFEHGKIHRPVSDGPAEIRPTGHLYFWEKGLLLWIVAQ
jgi:hypothetical protein